MFNAPLSLERADYLISLFDLAESATVLDIGCGNGAFLQRVAQAKPIMGVGIDTNADLIASANATWSNITSDSTLEFYVKDANDYVQDMSSVDLIICIGAEYALGGYRQLLETAKSKLNAGGQLLVGTIYWKQRPNVEYLKLMNGENHHFNLHDTVQMAYQMGYIPLDVGRSNDDEWDRFESRSNRRHYQNGNDWDRHWQWQSGYLRWGVTTMGFCYALLKKP